MTLQTHYEVHVQQGGRWSIHAQFAPEQKDKAIDEAKQLNSQGNIGAVKVIREVYDASQGTHRDYVVYKSAGVTMSDGETDATEWSPHPKAGNRKANNDDDDVSYFSFDLQPEHKDKAKNTLTGFLLKILLITLFSLGLASIAAMAATEVLGGSTLFGYRISGKREENMLVIVFVSMFLISASLMSSIVLRGTSVEGGSRRRRAPRRRRTAPRHQRTASQPAAADARKKRRGRREGDELDRAMAGSEDFALAEQNADDTNERLKKGISGNETVDADAGGKGVATMSPHAEKQKAYMMNFISNSLNKTGSDAKKMDNFNKFGVNLFLAGACETLANKRDLDAKSRAKILADSVRVTGFKESHASTFAVKYEEYLLQDPRYMQMYQAGRNAMNTHFQDPNNSAQHMAAALSEWNQPKKKTKETGPVTVLFTDIAGSTAMTQELGDDGAQEVVRIHNRIVRAALTGNQGREVKHTGDGIMASFDRVTSSVDAAIEMQRQTMIHNQQAPNLPLHLKIGINAGEPIVEDNDLFGTVVQLSARIVDKAQADEILVSEIIKGICTGKAYTFSDKGGHEMKGFDGPMRLYEVHWRDGAAAAK